jgi:ABC-type hemin transport system substrate-binding protein
MSMVTAMDGIGDVNHVDTVHDNVSEEYKQAMEKVMENKEEKETVIEEVETPVEATKEKMVMTKEEMEASGLQQLPVDENGNPIIPTDIWLQFNTLSVGVGENRHTFDLVKILEGLTRLAEVTIVRQEAQPVEKNATDDIEEVKQDAKWQHNGQPDNPTTNE